MPNLGDIIGGRYQIIDVLGSGGFGTTYLAKDIQLANQSRCAIKHLQPKFSSKTLWENAKQRFATEAMVLQRLGNHPQIPQMLAHIEEGEDFYLVQEFIDGEELRQEVSRELFDEKETIDFLQDTLEVLDFVHQQGVIHRDIKPSNLIRRRSDGKMVLIDFGAVKEISTLSFDAQTQSLMTSAIGTPGYMPPEQQSGRPFYSSDLYALGRTTIFALTGQAPSQLEDAQTGELKKWEKLISINPKLAAILNKMCRPRAADRYHSAAQVLKDLQPFLKVGQTIGGRYKINIYLGEESWSYTYLAENLWRPYQSPCVIKQLKLQTTDSQFLAEAERQFSEDISVLERLGDHPQIPKVFDHFEDGGAFYLVEEFIEGENLSKEIQAGRILPEDRVIEILQDSLEILDFIHQNRVIHRDINPSNFIRRKADGKLVLMNFGIWQDFVTFSSENQGIVLPQSLRKDSYVPPEQIAGRPTFSSDIYALGIMAIQGLTGLPPERLQTDRQTGEIIWPTGTFISPDLVKILNKMIALDLAKRYQSAAEVFKAIRSQRRTQFQSQTLPQLTSLPQSKLPSLNSRARYLLAGLGIGGLLLFLFFYIMQLSQTAFLFRQADLKITTQEYENAVKYYTEGLEKAPPLAGVLLNFERAWIQKAFALSSLKRYEEMLQACEQAIAINMKSPYGWICKGSALDSLQQYPEAVQAYNKAIEIDPNSYEAWHNLGQVDLKLKKKDAAIQDFQQAIRVGGEKSFVTWSDLGKLYFRYKEYSQAVNAYQEAIRVNRNYLPAWIGLGNAQIQLQQYQQAIDAYNQALIINDKSSEAWYGKGLAQEKLQQYSDAFKSYERAIFIKPDYQAAIDARQRVLPWRFPSQNPKSN